MELILELLEEDNDSDEDQEPSAEVNGIILLPLFIIILISDFNI